MRSLRSSSDMRAALRPANPCGGRSFLAGFSLVEILPAIAIAVLVVTTAGLLYVSVTRALGGREGRVGAAQAVEEALHALQADLFTALPVVETDAGGWKLEGPEGRAQLRFRAERPRRSEQEALLWAEPVAILWQLSPEGQAPPALVRVEQVLRGPAVPTTNRYEGIVEFGVLVEAGGEWHSTWAPEAGPSPRAARIRVASQRRQASVEAPIPSGLVVTSAVIRTTR